MKLTVFYEDPFWVGIVERENDGQVQAGRYVFGSEPSLQEIWEFVGRELPRVAESLGCAVELDKTSRLAGNPKRRAREAAKESRGRGVGTASQRAIQQELEQRKLQSRAESKALREERAAYKREVARQKAKAKHRGR